MAARPCTPPHRCASNDSSYFLHRRSISGALTERSRTPTAEPAENTSLETPLASRTGAAAAANPPASLCTPQTMPEELRLRAAVDAELARAKFSPQPPTAPAVTPLVKGLFVGGFPDEETVEILRREKIDIIINCCAGEYRTPDALQTEFVVYNISAEDQSDYMILYHCYEKFAAIVQNATRLGRRIFVHCIAGINRSVTLCLAYLMQYYSMDIITCIRLFQAHGRIDILRNVSFRHQLVDFYLNLL